MIKKAKTLQYTVHEHIEHWVAKTTYKDRLQWLEDANKFVALLRKRKGYPNLPVQDKNLLLNR